MNWTGIPNAPVYTWATAALAKEAARINKNIEKVVSLREKADAEKFDFNDFSRDRRPALKPVAAALKLEIEIRQSLIIFYNAVEQTTTKERQAVQAEQISFELEVRKKLAIPDYVQMPLAALQVERKYWELRAKFDSSSQCCHDSEIRDQTNHLAVARGNLHVLESTINGEQSRLDQFERARIANEISVAANDALDEERRTKRDGFFERVAALMRG
jgi:hypothetical protein